MKGISGELSRREFLHGVAGLASTAAIMSPLSVGPALAADKLTYITSFGLVVDFAPDLNMHSGGHLEKQGFTSDVISGRGSSNAIQALVADQAKFTRLGAMEILRAISKGEVDLVSVATVYQRSSFSLVHSSESKLGSLNDLVGKTVGIMSVGGISENFLDVMLINQGVDPTSVKREVVGNNPGNFELVKLGRIDAFMSSTGTNIAMKLAGLPFNAIGTDDFAAMPGQCYVTLRETVEKQPELVQRFVNAADASVREFMTIDAGVLYDRLKADFDIGGDRAAAIAGMEGFRGLVGAPGDKHVLTNNAELWASGAEALAKSGLAKVPDVTKAYTNAFVDKL